MKGIARVGGAAIATVVVACGGTQQPIDGARGPTEGGQHIAATTSAGSEILQITVRAARDDGETTVCPEVGAVHTGDGIFVELAPREAAYLAVIYLDPQQTATVLHAPSGAVSAPLRLPEQDTYVLTDPPGTETLWFMAARGAFDSVAPDIAAALADSSTATTLAPRGQMNRAEDCSIALIPDDRGVAVAPFRFQHRTTCKPEELPPGAKCRGIMINE